MPRPSAVIFVATSDLIESVVELYQYSSVSIILEYVYQDSHMRS